MPHATTLILSVAQQGYPAQNPVPRQCGLPWWKVYDKNVVQVCAPRVQVAGAFIRALGTKLLGFPSLADRLGRGRD